MSTLHQTTTKTLLIFLCLAAYWCGCASAVVITLKDGRRVGGWIIRKDQDRVVVDVVNQAGTRDREVFKFDEVDDVSYAVSATRLAELNPSEPIKYKRYAEELAEVTIDPEARPMSLRLYHIALMLDSGDVRDSCLLGMIAIARNPEEERRFRATAFLYRRNRDDTLIASPTPTAAASDQSKEQQTVLKLLRDLRMRKRLVVRDNELPLLRKALSPFTDAMTDEEVSKLFVVDCAQCENGVIDCPYCERGVVVATNRRTKCQRCQRGQIACPTCNDRFGKPGLADDLVTRIVSAELKILNSTRDDTPTATSDPDDALVSWSQIKSNARKRTIPALSLRNLTEFDPAKCLFRDGQWVAPGATE